MGKMRLCLYDPGQKPLILTLNVTPIQQRKMEELQTINPLLFKMQNRGFPGGAVVENLPANAGDTGSSPGLGRSHMPRSD